jgi:cytochrome c553
MHSVLRRCHRPRRLPSRNFHPQRLLARLLLVGVVSTGCLVRANDALARRSELPVRAGTADAAVLPTPNAPGDAAAGRDKAESERCQECHGPAGAGGNVDGSAGGKFPRLAGQFPDYIVKQIHDFRSGARKSYAMTVMANTLDDDDLLDIAAFFATQPRPRSAAGSAADAGKRLYFSGDAARNITACARCHGESGQGAVDPDGPVPAIAGQEWHYLDKQLRDWRSGERRNSRDGVMNRNAQSLTDPEISALADFISGQ